MRFRRRTPVRLDLYLDLVWPRHTFRARMKLTVNGEPQEVPEQTTVAGLLLQLGLSGPVAVERNAQVIPRAEHPSVVLAPGDTIEIVHFVGGG